MEERKPYPTDVTNDEWSFAASYLTVMKEDAPQRLRWLARAGAAWRLLPTNFPP